MVVVGAQNRNLENTEAEAMSSPGADLKTLKWINLVAYAANVFITYGIGVTGLFNLPTNAELSEKYQTLVTPIGWAFSIWGIIFTTQAIWVLQQFFRVSESTAASVTAVKCNYVYIVLAQASWTLTFSNELIEVSTGMMALILWNLFVVVRTLSKLEKDETERSIWIKAKNYFLQDFPFGIHFGWILAATVVNVNVFLVNFDFGSNILFYSAVGGVAFIAVATMAMILAGYVTAPLVGAWALLGVYFELQSPKETITNGFSVQQLESIQYGAIGVMALIVVATAFSCFRKIRSAQQESEPEESVYLRSEN